MGEAEEGRLMAVFGAVFLFLLIAGGWFIGCCLFVARSAAYEQWWGVASGIILGMVGIAAVIAFLVAAEVNDEHAHTLCLRGHEVWTSNTKSLYKRWICEEWGQ